MSNLSKRDLLKDIEVYELDRVNNLTKPELIAECEDWFNKELPDYDNDFVEMASEYVEDFMSYRRNDSQEELQEIANNYQKQYV